MKRVLVSFLGLYFCSILIGQEVFNVTESAKFSIVNLLVDKEYVYYSGYQVSDMNNVSIFQYDPEKNKTKRLFDLKDVYSATPILIQGDTTVLHIVDDEIQFIASYKGNMALTNDTLKLESNKHLFNLNNKICYYDVEDSLIYIHEVSSKNRFKIDTYDNKKVYSYSKIGVDFVFSVFVENDTLEIYQFDLNKQFKKELIYSQKLISEFIVNKAIVLSESTMLITNCSGKDALLINVMKGKYRVLDVGTDEIIDAGIYKDQLFFTSYANMESEIKYQYKKGKKIVDISSNVLGVLNKLYLNNEY